MTVTVRSVKHGTETEKGTLDKAKEAVDAHNENFAEDGEQAAGIKVADGDKVVVVPHPDYIENPDDPEVLEVVSSEGERCQV